MSAARLKLRACNADLPDVTMVRTAASAEHGDLRVPQPDVAVLRAEFNRIAVIEIGRVIELLVAPPRSVSADAARCSNSVDVVARFRLA